MTSQTSDTSAASVNSSNCDPQSLDEIPVILPPDLAAFLAAQNVTAAPRCQRDSKTGCDWLRDKEEDSSLRVNARPTQAEKAH